MRMCLRTKSSHGGLGDVHACRINFLTETQDVVGQQPEPRIKKSYAPGFALEI